MDPFSCGETIAKKQVKKNAVEAKLGVPNAILERCALGSRSSMFKLIRGAGTGDAAP